MSARLDPIPESLAGARRDQILDAAAKIFAAKGFHRATIKDIAREGAFAEGTIYNYFANKTDLVIGLLDRLNQTEERPAHFMAGQEQDPRAFAVTYMRQRLTLLRENVETFQAVLPEVLANPELRDRYYRQLVAPTTTLGEEYFRRLADKGALQNKDVPLFVRAFAGTILGLLILYILGDEELRRRWDELPELLVDMQYGAP